MKFTDDFDYETDELRVLPSGFGSNILVSKRGYNKEIVFRRERNRELAPENRFDLPKWEDLEIYDA